MLKKLWKAITHRHEYRKIGWRKESNGYIRYSVRKYECQTCGKIKWVDGRNDPYFG